MISFRLLTVLRRLTYAKSVFYAPKTLIPRGILCAAHSEVCRIEIRNMSGNIDEAVQDPKRHFDFQQLINKKKEGNIVLIDVREHSEINETGKLPDSIHIPLGELPTALGEISEEQFNKKYEASKPSKDATVIFSCKAGGRSLKALRLALELGYLSAGNYKGGWLDWKENCDKLKC